MTNKEKSVLLVEDSPTQALSIQLLLENEGLTVLHATNGTKGIKLAQEQQPDAILLDVELPGMNGFEIAVTLSKHPTTEHIPIIMLTKHNNTNFVRKSMVLGAIDFIPKDIYTNAILIETLKHLKVLEQSRIEIVKDGTN